MSALKLITTRYNYPKINRNWITIIIRLYMYIGDCTCRCVYDNKKPELVPVSTVELDVEQN